uniref:Uncharacterized protein n=1 Tax=Riboviria sp. TaxID=2585031 RepID=A0A514D890_9VIRU|nr:MAG: hypothetical protein H3BulkLitter169370_000002 [Riboviria sp.]
MNALLFLVDVPWTNVRNYPDTCVSDTVWRRVQTEIAAGKLPFAPRTAAPSRGVRLRRRSKYAAALRHIFGLSNEVSVSQVLSGRWLPDLTDSSKTFAHHVALNMMVEGGVRVLAGGLAQNNDPTNPQSFVWLSIEVQGVTLHISPDLYHKVAQYACFRPRTQETLLGIKSRALEEAKNLKMRNEDVALLIPGTVSLAMLHQVEEVKATSMMDIQTSPEGEGESAGWVRSLLFF